MRFTRSPAGSCQTTSTIQERLKIPDSCSDTPPTGGKMAATEKKVSKKPNFFHFEDVPSHAPSLRVSPSDLAASLLLEAFHTDAFEPGCFFLQAVDNGREHCNDEIDGVVGGQRVVNKLQERTLHVRARVCV